MTRRALTMALLAVLAGTPPLAARTSKTSYLCGTVRGPVKPAEGRLNTWNLAALSFTPDNRSTEPLLIRYRSITRLEYGRTPPHRVETPDRAPITLPCALKPERKHHYLTIFYKDVPPDEDEMPGKSEWEKQRDERTQARQDRRDRLERWDSKDLTDTKDEKSKNRRDQSDGKNARERRDQRGQTDQRDQTDQPSLKARNAKDEKDERGVKKEMEYFAVFELGDGVLRPALRILETRSGKRITYQDAQARKAAR